MRATDNQAAAQELRAAYRRQIKRRIAIAMAGAGLLALSFLIDLATGPSFLALDQVFMALLGQSDDRGIETIVWAIRVPVAVMAVLVGASLGTTGLLMQSILNNPLASSYTLGIAAGAGFGAALTILSGETGDYTVPFGAFLFSAIACLIVWGIGRLRGMTPEILVLAGIAVLFLFQALLALLQFMASQEALQMIVFWLFGSLQKATPPKNALIFAALLGVALFLLRDLWGLSALRLGDERARALGIRVEALRVRAFISIAVLTGVAVAFAGTIGFIGIIAPHISRMMVGEDHRVLWPLSAIVGALILSLASIASKMILPGTIIPIGIVTSLIGVPFFIWLIMTHRRSHW